MIEKIKHALYTWLRGSEKYTKTDMVYLAKGGFWLTLGNVISTIASLLLSIAFANLLPKETYGIYRYVLSIASILSITTLSGINSATTQAIARNFDHSFFDGLRTKIKWGTLGSAASIATAIYYYSQTNHTLTFSFLLIAICMPFMSAFDLYNSILNGKKLFQVYTKYNVLTQITYVAIMVATLLVTKSVVALVASYVLSNTILNLIFLIITLKKVKLNNQSDPTTSSFGKHLSVMYTLSTILAEIDKILIFHFLGAASLAIYSFALAPTDHLKGLLKNIQSLAYPKFANRSGSELKESILPKTWKLGIFISVGIFIYILFAPFLFSIIFPSYLDSIFYSQLLAFSVIGASLSMFVYTAIESQKAQRELYQFNIITNIFSGIILIPMIYYYGLHGAVIAKIVSRFFSFAFSIVLLKRIGSD